MIEITYSTNCPYIYGDVNSCFLCVLFTQETTVNISIYGQLVETRGFESRLIFNKTSHSQREYRVCVANNYGKVCKDIRNADDDEGIPIQYLF